MPDGSNTSINKVWNPSDEVLRIKIIINEREVAKDILPKETTNVVCPVNSNTIDMQFIGDRRLVILETAFDFNK